VVLVNEGESTVSLRRHGPAMLRDLAKLAWRDWRGTAFSPDALPAVDSHASEPAAAVDSAALPSAHLASGSGVAGRVIA